MGRRETARRSIFLKTQGLSQFVLDIFKQECLLALKNVTYSVTLKKKAEHLMLIVTPILDN